MYVRSHCEEANMWGLLAGPLSLPSIGYWESWLSDGVSKLYTRRRIGKGHISSETEDCPHLTTTVNRA